MFFTSSICCHDLYTAAFTLMGLIAYGIELITYPLLQWQKLGIIKKTLAGRQFFSMILIGDESKEIPKFYLTYYVETDKKTENNHGMGYSDIILFSSKKNAEDMLKLGEELEDVFKGQEDLQDLKIHSGDIHIDYKKCKVFKYGISIQIQQNVFSELGSGWDIKKMPRRNNFLHTSIFQLSFYMASNLNVLTHIYITSTNIRHSI